MRRLEKYGTVLFQGDSITDAFRRPDERNESFQLGNGYVFLIASRLRFEHPGWPGKLLNRGISGNRLADLTARWTIDALDLRPDVISLLVGINDTMDEVKGWGQPAAVFEDGYRALLTRTRAALPGVALILCEPFAISVGDVTPVWRELLAPRQAAVRRLAVEFGACWVPLQEAFDAAAGANPAHWCYDGMHPTPAGFALVAQEWTRCVEAWL